jgi:hypothetical protein
VQILPLIKKNVCSYLTSYAITKILQWIKNQPDAI